MAITQVGTATTGSATAPGTSFTATLPTGWQAGDVAYICLMTASVTVPTVTGWTTIASYASASRTYVFRRVLQAGDSSPVVTVGNNSLVWTVVGFRGVDNTTPEGPIVENRVGSSLQNAYVPTNGGALLGVHSNSSAQNGTPPSGWTELADVTVTSAGIQVNTYGPTNEGAPANVTETTSGSSPHSICIELMPVGWSTQAGFMGASNGFQTTAGATTWPTGYTPVAGDVAYLFTDSNATLPVVSTTGWTRLMYGNANGLNNSTLSVGAIWRSVLAGGDSAPSFSTVGSTHWCIAILRGVDTVTPEDDQQWNGMGTTASGLPAAPSITAVLPGDWLFTQYGLWNSNTGTPPSGAAELDDDFSNVGLIVNLEKLAATGASGTRTEDLSGTTSNPYGASIAVRPLIAAGTIPSQIPLHANQAVQRASSW